HGWQLCNQVSLWSFREPNGAVMTKMKPPQEGRNAGAPSLRGLQRRSATGLNTQAAKQEVSAVWRRGWMPENISGVPAGRSVFHLTSPFIGLLRHGQDESLHPQSRFRDMPQISRGKCDRLRCTTAGFTTSALERYGLRNHCLA